MSKQKVLNADDPTMMTDNTEELEKTLQEWNNIFRKHGYRINLEKIEVIWIGQQEVDLHVIVDGKTIKQVDSFAYLGIMMCDKVCVK